MAGFQSSALSRWLSFTVAELYLLLTNVNISLRKYDTIALYCEKK